MSDFDSVRIENSEGSLSTDEFLLMSHDPEMLYQYIKGVSESFGEDNKVYEKSDKAGIYSRIEAFRAFMQYVEEFGIYLLFELEDKDDLVKHVTETTPKEVKKFFEEAVESGEQSYLEKKEIDENYESCIERMFGYDLILENNADISNIKERENLSDSDVEDKVEESIEAIKLNIREMANFFLQFENAYNAIKHGTRVIPKKRSKIEISGPSDFKGELNLETVTFLCKKENDKYFLEIPVKLLVQESLKRLDSLKMMFEDIREISQAPIRSSEEINFKFYKRVSSDDKVSEDYMMLTNPDSRIILPSEERFSEYMDEPLVKPVGASIYPEGDDVIFETANRPYTEPDYPLIVKMKVELSDGVKPGFKQADQDFKFNLSDLDVKQYSELFSAIEMLEKGKADRVRIRDVSRDKDHLMEPGDMDSVERPSKLSDKNLETLKSIQLATRERILMPVEVNEQIQSILEEYRDSENTKSDAQKHLDKLKKEGVFTGLSPIQRTKMILRNDSQYILDYEELTSTDN